MKKIVLIFLALAANVNGQNLPILHLSAPINSKLGIKSPLDLNKGEICVTLIQGAGMDGFDHYTHYVYTNDGNVQTFKEEVPKAYLKNLKRTMAEIEIDGQTKEKLLNKLNSGSTIDFTAFSQKDFLKPVKAKAIQPPCVVDAAGYSISFIQGNKQKVFSFYAPEYYYSGKCKDENINKKVLGKFIDLLKLWEVI
jgi:hypothetical protein